VSDPGPRAPEGLEGADELRSQFSKYVQDLRSALERERSSNSALAPALSQLRSCAEDLQSVLRRSQQASALLEQGFLGLLSWLVDSAERRDGESLGHSQRVARYSRILCETLGLAPEQTEWVETAGRFHDAGRASWSDALLLSRGPFSDAERDAARSHCALAGAFGCEPHSLLGTLGDVIRHHHERWDGSGYPQGLLREAIPLHARIVQLADVYDTLRTAYRYKTAQSHVAACRAILQGDRRNSPAHFDPHLLDAFGRAAPQLEAASHPPQPALG
jgi:putative two-component system response regulator